MSDPFVDSLQAKHAELERRIQAEMISPHPDQIKIREWKKQKLALKDRTTILIHA